MTIIELILHRLKRGATIVAITNAQARFEITELRIVTRHGAEISLPQRLFPELSPYLIERDRTGDTVIVYTLRETGPQ